MPLVEWLIDRAAIYTESPSTGDYTTLAAADIACRLVKIDASNAGSARAELLATRRLVWGPGYEMPSHAQVEVNAQRWNVVGGTMGTFRRKHGDEVYRAADVVRADAG